MSRSKDKGTKWETALAAALMAHGAPSAERRTLQGAGDRGDLSGVPGVVFEAKAEARQDLAGWTAELLAEMANDGSDIGLVWAKRVGKASALDGYMIVPPIVGLRLLARAGYLDPEDRWTGTVDTAGAAQALLDARAVDLANAYHWATAPDCDANVCPGVLECRYAEDVSLVGFRAVADGEARP